MENQKEDQDFDPEENRALVLKTARELQRESEEALESLESLLKEVDTFNLLGWFSVQNLSIDPEAYSEAAHGGSAAKVEFLALQGGAGEYEVRWSGRFHRVFEPLGRRQLRHRERFGMSWDESHKISYSKE